LLGVDLHARNVIAGNGVAVLLYGIGSGNFMEGNYIGTDVTGTKALGNVNGVLMAYGTQNNVVGGMPEIQRYEKMSRYERLAAVLIDCLTAVWA
jgi:hypothetical protein